MVTEHDWKLKVKGEVKVVLEDCKVFMLLAPHE